MIDWEQEQTPKVGRSILKTILYRSPRSTPALGGSWRSSRMQLAMKWRLRTSFCKVTVWNFATSDEVW
jgi:hypothetical protein